MYDKAEISPKKTNPPTYQGDFHFVFFWGFEFGEINGERVCEKENQGEVMFRTSGNNGDLFGKETNER